MKTSTKIFTGIAAIAILLSSTGAVFADSGETFAQNLNRGQGQGRGNESEQDGILEDYMTAAMAEVLGLTIDEIEDRYNADDSFITIALSQGFAIEDVDKLMDDVRLAATEIAASEGVVLGRQEANQMASQMGANGMGGMIVRGDEAPRLNMTDSECDETCDSDGISLYENATGISMMRRGRK